MSAILGHFYEVSLVYICIAVGDPVINRDPINQFNTVSCLCLSQVRSCIYNVIFHGHFVYVQFKWRLEVIFCFCWYWWNWWPSLFKPFWSLKNMYKYIGWWGPITSLISFHCNYFKYVRLWVNISIFNNISVLTDY